MGVFGEVRVLELGRVFSGPLCGMALADMGARVLKVERPGVGDESRRFGLHRAGGQSCYFNALNRNKKSVALDLAEPADRALFEDLVRRADVLVHNWIQASLDRLGFSWEAVHALNPRLIYCAISGYGAATSFASRPAQDIIAQALSGFMSLTGERDGPPLKSAIPVVDYATGLYAAFAISAALFERTSTGEGQLIRLSLLQTAVAMTSFAASEHLSCGASPARTGNRHPSICPYNLYATADGYVVMAVANDAMWGRCREALGLLDDTRFATNRQRLEHQDDLEALIEARMAALGTAEVVALLEAHKVSCAQVNPVGGAFESPPVAELGMIADTGAARFVGSPVCRPGAKPVPLRAPPALGQDEDEVRATLDW
ncbi:MAG: CoA transferase [Pseudomonadota bacterium]